MAVDPDFEAHVRDLFAGLGPLRSGRMFSGVALYAEEDAMFAMIAADGVVYLKTSPATIDRFREAGSEPFTYMRREGPRETSLMSLPEPAMDDPDAALAWAQLAMGPAREAAEKKRAGKARRSARKTAG
ncbi:competence protein TfoX [Aquicoccus sp. SCR17]|nr:competence protein TfoX [Carideicomes alvinocaridis]